MNPPEVVQSLIGTFAMIGPEIVLGAVACLIFLGGTIRADRHLWAASALLALGGAGIVLQLSRSPGATFIESVSPLTLDSFALLIKLLALVGGGILVLLSWNEVPDRQAADYHACLLVVIAGLCLTGSANELVTLFLALELISIPTYVMLYLPRHDTAAQEASIKYFLLSIFSSALMLFGFSYLYGLAGTTNIPAILEALTRSEAASLPGLAQVALVMVVAGLGFKITAVPFHFYAPDVYQGAPTSVAALLAYVPKVAGFAALLRVLGYLWPGADVPGLALGPQVPILFWILAAMTMSLGNVLALLQDNVKRMLAYSSVAHAGYMLIGLAVAPDLSLTDGQRVLGGVEAILFYLAAYGAMTLGAFGVLAYLSTPQRPVETVDDLAGLSRSHSGVALLMALFLFSLIGIPLTAGFVGKLLLFLGALAVPPKPALAEHARLFWWLALIGAVNAGVAGFYYLRIIGVMYLRTTLKPVENRRTWPGLVTLWVCAALTLGLGIYPRLLLDEAQAAAPAPSTKPAGQ